MEETATRGPDALFSLRRGQLGRVLVASGCVALAAIYVITRSFGLDLSLWEDEIYTATHYVAGGFSAIFNPEGYIANNHPLFSVLGIVLTRVIDSHEVALRLGSVVPATVGSLLLVYWLWRRVGHLAAIVMAVCIVVSPLHFDLYRQARGWGLALLGVAIGLTASLEMQSQRLVTWPHVLWFVAGALIGIWAVYPLAVVFAVHWLILVLTCRERKLLALGGGLVLLGSLAFYWPLLGVLSDPVGARSVAQGSSVRDGVVTLGNALYEPLHRLLVPIFELAVPSALAIVVSIVLVAAGVYAVTRKLGWETLLQLVVPIVVVFGALAVRQAGIWDRYVSYLLPHILTLVAVGASAVWLAVRGQMARLALAVVSAAVTLALVGGFVSFARPVMALPVENFKGAARLIEGGAPYRAAYTRSLGSSFAYNLRTVDLVQVSRAEFYRFSCDIDGPAVFVEYPRRMNAADTSCLEVRGSRIQLPQRRDPPISIWLVP